MKILFILAYMLVVLFLAAPNKVEAQKAPDCRISNIKIVPFDSLTGAFREEIKPNEDPGFFNEFGISLFVVVEISSQSYFKGISVSDANKDIKVEITVMEDKRQKAKKIKQISLADLLEGGKVFGSGVMLWC